MAKYLISCGGTGGHLSPGISVADELATLGHQCKLIISHKQVDSRLIEKYHHLEYVKSPGVAFSWNPLRLPIFLWQEIRALTFAYKLLRSEKPDVVIGFGGFITLAVGLWAFFLRIPLALHEANRKPGRAIRVLARLATRVYLPPGVRMRGVSSRVIRNFGYPVRAEIQQMPSAKARQKLGLPNHGKVLLVLGGSQGALTLNRWVTRVFEHLGRENIHVYCVTGLGKGTQGTIEVRPDNGSDVSKAIFVDFCEEMRTPLNAADIVIARAGAGSIAEFIRCRLPSILVPYPHASDNHQLENARYMERQGASVIVEETRLETLTYEVLDLIYNDWLIERFRHNLDRLNQGDDLARIVKDLDKLAQPATRRLPANHDNPAPSHA